MENKKDDGMLLTLGTVIDGDGRLRTKINGDEDERKGKCCNGTAIER